MCLIPLWPNAENPNVERLLKEMVPRWWSFTIRNCGKYLGFWIGPGAGKRSWDAPLVKYVDRCEYISSLGSGPFYTVFFYKMFALSVLSYVMQLSESPPASYEAEERIFRRTLKGPGNLVTKQVIVEFGQSLPFAIWISKCGVVCFIRAVAGRANRDPRVSNVTRTIANAAHRW